MDKIGWEIISGGVLSRLTSIMLAKYFSIIGWISKERNLAQSGFVAKK